MGTVVEIEYVPLSVLPEKAGDGGIAIGDRVVNLGAMPVDPTDKSQVDSGVADHRDPLAGMPSGNLMHDFLGPLQNEFLGFQFPDEGQNGISRIGFVRFEATFPQAPIEVKFVTEGFDARQGGFPGPPQVAGVNGVNPFLPQPRGQSLGHALPDLIQRYVCVPLIPLLEVPRCSAMADEQNFAGERLLIRLSKDLIHRLGELSSGQHSS